MLFLLVPCQIPFQFEGLFTLIAVECGVKWEVGMDALYVEFQVSLKSEGLLSLITLPLLLVGERMKIFNVSLHIFQSFKLLTANGVGAMVHFSWFL